MTIEINDYPAPGCGLGVTINHVAWQMVQHPGERYWVNIRSSSPYYEAGHGPNPWDYYFVQPEPAPPLRKLIPPGSLALSGHHGWSLAHQQAIRPRVEPHIVVRPEIMAEIESFKARFFKGRVMGVHLRGSDKIGEYRPMPKAEIVTHLNALRQRWKPDTIFLATDDVDYHRMMEPFGAVSLTFARSKLSLHHYPPNGPYQSGKTAVMDAWLLAACDYLAHTPSNFATIPLIMGRHRDIFCLNKFCVITPFMSKVNEVLGLNPP